MARNSSISGLLMRQTLLGSGNGIGNGSFQTQGLGRLDNPKFFPNCIQTLKWISTAPSLSPSIHITSTPKSPVFLDSLHFLQHRRRLSSAPAPAQFQSPSPFPAPREIKFPSPAAMVILREEDEYRRAIRKVKDEQLPAVFYFVRHDSPNSILFGSPTTRKMREQFPHVTVYKFEFDTQNWYPLAGRLGVSSLPTFHFYQNGKKVDEIFPSPYLNRLPYEIPNLVLDTCEKFYRHVIQVEKPHPMGSSGKGKGKRKSTYQQLVVQAKTDANENDKVVALGGGRLGDASTSSEQSDGPVEAVDSRGSAPSLDEAMRAVSAMSSCYEHTDMWWYAKGVFKADPQKRATLLKNNDDAKDFCITVEGGMDLFAFEDFLLEQKRKEQEILVKEQAERERQAEEQRRIEAEKAASEADRALAEADILKRRQMVQELIKKAARSVEDVWHIEPGEFKGEDLVKLCYNRSSGPLANAKELWIHGRRNGWKDGLSIVERLLSSERKDGDWWYANGCIYGCKNDAERIGFFCHAALQLLLQSGFHPEKVAQHQMSSNSWSSLFGGRREEA